MTQSKEPAKPAAELSEQDLNKASGGAFDAFQPTNTERAHLWADKSAAGDGSVKTNSALIGLLKQP